MCEKFTEVRKGDDAALTPVSDNPHKQWQYEECRACDKHKG